MTVGSATRTEATEAARATLVDRMTGRLGTRAQVEAQARRLQAAVQPALQAALCEATGLPLDVRPGEIRSGRRRALLGELGDGAVFCSGSIENWTPHIGYLCDPAAIVALVECLLGNAELETIKPQRRALSAIELDMSLVVFEQFAATVKAAVASDPKLRATAGKPASGIPAQEDDPTPDFHAAAIGFDLEFGPVTAPIHLVVSQEVLLKTQPILPAPAAREASREKSAWKERLSRRVARSEVRLEARMALVPIPLSAVSRLQPGDLLAFPGGGPRVTLGVNGKDLYSCALGRSGQRYMVRLEGPAGVDQNWRDELG